MCGHTFLMTKAIKKKIMRPLDKSVKAEKPTNRSQQITQDHSDLDEFFDTKEQKAMFIHLLTAKK